MIDLNQLTDLINIL